MKTPLMFAQYIKATGQLLAILLPYMTSETDSPPSIRKHIKE